MADLETLPPPPIPAGADLTDFPYMPLQVARLRRSKAWLICKRRPDLAFYMLNLWTAAWHERPAGSLEDDDDVLADLAMCSPERFDKLREAVLRGWVKCSDGRLYHPVVAEVVLEVWEQKCALEARLDQHNSRSSGAWLTLRAIVFARDHYTCRYCSISSVRLECDHVIPVSRGGKTKLENLVAACLPCNRSKGSKLLSEWSRGPSLCAAGGE
jgi:hypothetical protein